MNSIYRSIWNEKTGTFVAVSESAMSAGRATSSGKTTTGRSARFSLKALAVSLMMAFGANVFALPVGGVVTEGGAGISSTASSTTITQSSQNVAINWQSFGIGTGQAVQFVQPNSSSVALNRVLGPDPSSILGSLSANGKVFLVNPNGILFGHGAQVNVGGLVASTLNISDGDFMAGNYQFSGNSGAAVLNQGTINAPGGYVALLGANVGNDGTILARLGTVALAAGNAITLDVAGDGLLNVTVNQGAVNVLVQNGGLIQADGGNVLLTAMAAGNLLQSAVNNTGVIQAQTIENRNGTIRLMGDMQTGTVNVGGTLDASAPNGGNGGFIETSAAHVKVQDSARITTAAPSGRTGTWLIDPVDFTIAALTGDMTGAQLSASLGLGNVTILSTSGAVGINGDINVADTVTWAANKLTLNAQRNININTAMMGSGTASLSLLYGQAAVNAGNTATYNVLAPINLPAGPNFTTQLGFDGVPVNYTVITSLGAAGSVTGTDLQGMGGNGANLAKNYALGRDIAALPTAGWGAFGFDPVGTIGAAFTGNFDGLGHTITGLTINRPLMNNVGLFGYTTLPIGVTLKNVTLSGGSVTGGLYVGNLVGHMSGDILNSHSTQAVTTALGGGYAGGLVGWSTGNITNSTSTGPVVGGTTGYVGGLVGWITGNIECCFASGTVNATGLYVGGLVGWITGSINRSYATGNVTTTGMDAGGLAGKVDSTGTSGVTNSYATGSVTDVGFINVGGLIGENLGNITNSFSSGTVNNGGAGTVGGLVGVKTGGVVTNSYWDTQTSGQALSAGGVGMTTADMKIQGNYTGWDFVNIWNPPAGTYPTLQVCLAPATWVAVPLPFVPPVPPGEELPGLPPPDIPIETVEEIEAPGFAEDEMMILATAPAWVPTVVTTRTPPQLLSLAPPVVVVPPPPPPPPPPVVAPPVYVPPVLPPKQDRN